MNQYNVGDVASVRIVKLMTFGAFAEVVPGVDGLIHISQIADRRIEKPEDVLSEGQVVEAKITAVDEEKKKISCPSALCWLPLLRKSSRTLSNQTAIRRQVLLDLSLFAQKFCDFFHVWRCNTEMGML